MLSVLLGVLYLATLYANHADERVARYDFRVGQTEHVTPYGTAKDTVYRLDRRTGAVCAYQIVIAGDNTLVVNLPSCF